MRELTLSDIKKMNDQVVHIVFPDLAMNAIVAYHATKSDGDDVYFTNSLGGRSTYDEVIEMDGTIYRCDVGTPDIVYCEECKSFREYTFEEHGDIVNYDETMKDRGYCKRYSLTMYCHEFCSRGRRKEKE